MREDVTLDFLRDAKCEHAVPRCEESFGPAVSYDVTDNDYSNGLFDAHGVQVTVSGFPLVRRSISIGTLLLGWDPRHSVEVYDEKMKPLDETYSGGFMPLYSSMALSFVESSDYRAIGARLEIAYDPIATPIGATIMLGPSIYKWSGGRTTRLDVGVKLTYGFEVLNVALLLERAHEVDESGRFRRRYFVTPGVELTLSNSWLRSVFHRKGGPCCKGE
jgi:hypothetical protein